MQDPTWHWLELLHLEPLAPSLQAESTQKRSTGQSASTLQGPPSWQKPAEHCNPAMHPLLSPRHWPPSVPSLQEPWAPQKP